MGHKVYTCDGGTVVMPEPGLVLVDRRDGGNLVVVPTREVWERAELSATELMQWSCLVAATAKAMLDVLPQLEGGCVNYWEAGNWSLNYEIEPRGIKRPKEHRRVHLHLLGRSPAAKDSSWRWGEAPIFPSFVDRYAWAETHEELNAEETRNIIARTEELLCEKYGFDASQLERWFECVECGYPSVAPQGETKTCADCRAGEP